MKICVNCGDKLLDTAKRCPTCGMDAKNFPVVDKGDKERIDEIIRSVPNPKSGLTPKWKSNLESRQMTRSLTSRPAEIKEKLPSKKQIVQQRKDEAERQGLAYCPKCGSTSISTNKRGFGFGKGVLGAAITPIASVPVGLLTGGLGANKVEITCLKCGHKWKPGKK